MVVMVACLKCGGYLANGYGLASGGGLGPYWYCEVCGSVLWKSTEPASPPPGPEASLLGNTAPSSAEEE